jgi:hypothetical protein
MLTSKLTTLIYDQQFLCYQLPELKEELWEWFSNEQLWGE